MIKSAYANRCQPCFASVVFAFFYSNESQEPPHIHIKAAENEAKFWLQPIRLAFNYGYRSGELNEIERLVREYQDELLEAWNGYFNPKKS